MAWLFDAGGNDGYNDCRNLAKVDTDRHGILFLPIKALAVAAGWTVKGSGRTGAYEFQGSTGGAGTGSGGAYDVWNSVANVSSALSWCVLVSPAGDELLLVGTNQAATSWDAYGSVLYLPGGGYTATGVNATTPPATVAGEIAVRSGRPFGSAANLVDFNSGTCRMHVAFDDAVDKGVWRFLVFVTAANSATPHDTWGVMTISDPPAWETKAWFFLGAAGGGANTGASMFQLWERQSEGLGSARTFTGAGFTANCLTANVAPAAHNDDPSTGTDNMWSLPYLRQFGVANEEYLAGVIRDMHARGHTGLDYPNYYDVLLDDGVTTFRYVHWGNAGLPWGDVASSPPTPILGAATTGSSSGAEFFNIRRDTPSAPTEDDDPTIDFDPAAGAIAHDDVLQVQTDDATGISQIAVWVKVGDVLELVAMVHVEAGAVDTSYFNEAYAAAGSVDPFGSEGFSVDVSRIDDVREGWPWSSFELHVLVTDSAGNVAHASAAYTVSPSYETAPAFDFTPNDASTIAFDDTVQVDVTETAPDSILRARIVASYASLPDEVVFDDVPGAGGRPGFTVVESAITDGRRWVVSRDDGWPDDVTLTVVVETAALLDPDAQDDASYTVTRPAPSSAFTPADSATIAFDDTVQVDVTVTGDVVAHVRIEALRAGEPAEVIFDGAPGSGALDGFDVTESAITDGRRFVVEREDGWETGGLSLRVTATGEDGESSEDSADYTVTAPDAPTIDFDPADGSSFDYDTAVPIDVEVTDPGTVARVRIHVLGATRAELVYDDAPGGTEEPGYTVGQTVISGGRRYSIERVDGWFEDFDLVVLAENALGEETTESAAYTLDTLPTPPDVTAPTVSNPQPTPGTPISATTPLSVDVTDDAGAFRRVIVAVEVAGITEIAWDGDAFIGRFTSAGCSRTPIAGGFRFTVLRSGGWTASPRLRVFAFDLGGNEV